jgi:hypothetical protein
MGGIKRAIRCRRKPGKIVLLNQHGLTWVPCDANEFGVRLLGEHIDTLEAASRHEQSPYAVLDRKPLTFLYAVRITTGEGRR